MAPFSPLTSNFVSAAQAPLRRIPLDSAAMPRLGNPGMESNVKKDCVRPYYDTNIEKGKNKVIDRRAVCCCKSRGVPMKMMTFLWLN